MTCPRVVLALVLAVGGLAGATFASIGCVPCNESACASTLFISVVERDGGALAPGLWEFEIVADGDSLAGSCEIGESSRTADCETSELAILPLISHHPDNPYTTYQISFTGGDGLDTVPHALELTIVHEGAVVFSESFEPDYDLAEPARCDPDCYVASLDAVIDRG